MTTTHRNHVKTRHNLDSQAFAIFMRLLSSNTEEAGRLYNSLHQKLVGFFSLKGLPDPVSAADETIDRAILKISAGTQVPDVNKYCLGIARNVAKERWRHAQRENSAFLEFNENLADTSDEFVARIDHLLKPCFDQLAADEQKLLMAYCLVARGRARAEHRRELADSMKTTVSALRIRVTRLRNRLTDCVKKRSREG
jgi:DNA-directed RNA polymerase specialized sigma24 family protein